MSNSVCFDTDTKLMLHCDGTNLSTTFTDNSYLAFTITTQGDAKITTAQSKFGGASGVFDGTGDYLTVPDNDVWDFGTGDFTVEFWLRWNTVGAAGLFEISGTDFYFWRSGAGNIECVLKGVGINAAWTPSAATWYHVAFIRNGGTGTIYIDGTSQVSGTMNGNMTAGVGGLSIAAIPATDARKLDGWMDEIRVSNVAIWTANFTAPSAAYVPCPPDQSFVCCSG